MIFDVRNLDELEGLNTIALENRRELVRQEQQKKILEQKRLLSELTAINEDLNDLILYNQKISEALQFNAKFKKQENYSSVDIVGQYIQLETTENREKFIHSLVIDEDILFAILEKEPCNYEIYDLQMHIIELEYLSSEFIKKVIELELDSNMFKLDLKIKALSHKNVDEKVIAIALKDSFFDVKNLAAEIAKERNFESTLEKASLILEENNNFTKLSQAQIIFETLKSGFIPDGDKNEIEDSLHFFEKRVKLSEDNDFVEKSLKEVDEAWKTFKTHFKVK